MSPTHGRTRLIGCLGALCAALAALAAAASPALAARPYDSQITGFNGVSSVAFDAAGHPWITDAGQNNGTNPGHNGLYEYDPYPSQTLLTTPNTNTPWGFTILSLTAAVDWDSGDVYVAQSNGRTVDIFSNDGVYQRSWTGINGASGGANSGAIHIAIDHSNTYSRGRIYLSLTSPENDVEVVDVNQIPVDFPATAPYISDNRLTGTPSGPFGQVTNVAVDTEGNIYVTDAAQNVLDMFDSTGTFLRAFPDPNADAGNSSNPSVGGAAVDPLSGDVVISGGNAGLTEYDAFGNLIGTLSGPGGSSSFARGQSAFDPAGRLYARVGSDIAIYAPADPVPAVTYEPVSDPTTTSGTLNATVDPNGGGAISDCQFEYGTSASYGTTTPCVPASGSLPFSGPTDVSADLSSLTTETTYHYRVVVTGPGGVKYGADQTYTPHHVVGLRTDPATAVTANGATLNGSLVGDGTSTHYYFEWGKTSAYGNTSAAAPGADAGSPSGPGATPLSFELTGLQPDTTYHYRVVASNGAGEVSSGADRRFTTPPGAPSISAASVTDVHSDRAILHGQVIPNGAEAKAHFEYVDDESFQASGWADAAQTSDVPVGMGRRPRSISATVDGLEPGTHYHYRVVGVNSAGTGVPATDHTFTTFAFLPVIDDHCANAHVRQQTGTSLLLDCRAYELASAANSGGYDVESSLVPGQTPYGAYPNALGPSQVLYGVHDGAIPGTDNPTNHGVAPYVATRGEDGWTTRYAGIPANNPFNTGGPFSSTLDAADAGLDTFAFSGPDICNPCFADGSSGIPVRLPDGSLVQGMAGSIPVSNPQPAGTVKEPLSADGSHFVFGSTQRFEPKGNNSGSDVTIYERDLAAGTTQVVSTDPGGDAIADGDRVAELAISSDGSHVVIGDLVSTDAAGNKRWHLYMHVGDAAQSVDLMPGATQGALFDGMTADGSRVYLTSAEQLSGDDSDASDDIFAADIDGGSATLTRVSTGSGGAGNSDACDPAANTVRPHWNTVGAGADCSAVAVGGGGGVAPVGGGIYFLSPEQLAGSSDGVQDAPNLYEAEPGQAPRFVATLESSANAPLPPSTHPHLRSFGTFGNVKGVAMDHSNGDVYVLDIGTEVGTHTGTVYKFDAEGHPVTSFGTNGRITVAGMVVFGATQLPLGIAVDNDPSSPNYRDLYVPDLQSNAVHQYDSSGAHVSDITGISFPTAVAVSPANGNVYVASVISNTVYGYTPAGTPLTPASFPTIAGPTGVAVGNDGKIYVVNGGGLSGAQGTTEVYAADGTDLGQLDPNSSYGVAVDSVDGHVYVNEGNRAVEYDPATRDTVGSPFGAGLLDGGIGIAADSGAVAAVNPGDTNVAMFGPAVTPADSNTDNPLVVDSVGAAGERKTADFQVTPDGRFAIFTSTLPLIGYDNGAHREVYRYDSVAGELACPSCNPTGEQATGDATLAPNGLNISDDGRVFFDSTEGLVDRDLNGNMDAYEWESGTGTELISTGRSPFNARLLGVSSDGTDVYFFTRDRLVNSDQNGSRVKIYDARAGGGYPFVPPPIPCAASDECHGPGTQAPAPPQIKSLAGTPVGNVTAPRGVHCRRGQVKRHGRCVRRKHRKRRHAHHRRKGGAKGKRHGARTDRHNRHGRQR